jgi:protease-4
MDRRAAWVLGIIFGGLFLCLFGFLLILFITVRGDSRRTLVGVGDRVGVVEVLGPILDAKKVLREIEEFRDEDRIKAVVVRIDSPGGAVGPSQEIYGSLRKLRETKKVVVSMGSMAASGGFYIACAGEKVFANPGTLTGSIGVLLQLPNFQGVLKWAGVEMRTITSGKMKDSGSVFREMTPEEKSYFQKVLSDVHQQFLEAVAEGRGISVDELKPNADGRIFTGRQAKELKLVDELGGFEEAVAEAGRLGGIRGRPKLEYPKQEKKFFKELFDDGMDSLFRGAATRALNELGVGLQYRLPMVETQ